MTYFTREGDKVVFAQTGDVYVPYEHHFVVIFCEDSIVYDVCATKGNMSGWIDGRGSCVRGGTCQTFFVALRHPHQCLGIPYWRPNEALSIRILPYALEDRSYRRRELLLASSTLCRCGIEARYSGLCFVKFN